MPTTPLAFPHAGASHIDEVDMESDEEGNKIGGSKSKQASGAAFKDKAGEASGAC